MRRFLVLLPLLLAPITLSAQELSVPLRSRTDATSAAPLRLSPVMELRFGGAWSAALPWMPARERPLAQTLFSQDMLRKAIMPDPNKSLRIYRSDPQYYRFGGLEIGSDIVQTGVDFSSIFRPSDRESGPTRYRLLNGLISNYYVHFREGIAARNQSAVDYMDIPNNTGMLKSFRDCKEKAWMRGEEQVDEIHTKIELNAWPYAGLAKSLKRKTPLGL